MIGLRTRMSSWGAYCPLSQLRTAPQKGLSRCKATSVDTVTSVATDASTEKFEPSISGFNAIKPASFISNNSEYMEEFRVRLYEVAPDQKTTILTIANMLQEIASNHCVGAWGRNENGFSVPECMKPDQGFVMTRLQIRMFKYPKWGDVVQVQTYIAEEGRLAARRDWRIVDAKTGESFGAATSTWLAISMTARKVVKMPDYIRSLFKIFGTNHMHALPLVETKVKIPDLVIADQVEGPKQVARRSDMDMNGHINNVTYVGWVMESIPEDLYNDGHLYQIEVDFKTECHAGQTVETLCSELSADQSSAVYEGAGVRQLLHTVRRCDGGECNELVRARTTWM